MATCCLGQRWSDGSQMDPWCERRADRLWRTVTLGVSGTCVAHCWVSACRVTSILQSDSRQQDEAVTSVFPPSDCVCLSVSFRPVYIAQDTVGLLLTKTTNHTQGIPHRSKTHFQALCLAGAPPQFSADGLWWQIMCFLFWFFVARVHCHIINSNSCFCAPLSVADMETNKKNNKKRTNKNSYQVFLPHRGMRPTTLIYVAQFTMVHRNAMGPWRRETAVPVWSWTLQTFFPP